MTRMLVFVQINRISLAVWVTSILFGCHSRYLGNICSVSELMTAGTGLASCGKSQVRIHTLPLLVSSTVHLELYYSSLVFCLIVLRVDRWLVFK